MNSAGTRDTAHTSQIAGTTANQIIKRVPITADSSERDDLAGEYWRSCPQVCDADPGGFSRGQHCTCFRFMGYCWFLDHEAAGRAHEHSRIPRNRCRVRGLRMCTAPDRSPAGADSGAGWQVSSRRYDQKPRLRVRFRLDRGHSRRASLAMVRVDKLRPSDAPVHGPSHTRAPYGGGHRAEGRLSRFCISASMCQIFRLTPAAGFTTPSAWTRRD